MCRLRLLMLLALTVLVSACGTTTLKPEPVRCDPMTFDPGPVTLTTLSKGTAGEIVSAHQQDTGDYADLRGRHLALVACVQAYGLTR